MTTAAEDILHEAYTDRNLLAQLCACLASQLGMNVDVGNDPDEPDWPVLYIHLPTGQISFHMSRSDVVALPITETTWDGHDTETKRERIRAYLRETALGEREEAS